MGAGDVRGFEIREDLKELVLETSLELVDLKAGTILPEIPVKEKSGDMAVLPAGTAQKRAAGNERAAHGGYKRSTYEGGSDDYKTKVYGNEEVIDEIEEMDLEDIYSSEEMASVIVKNSLLLEREKRVADAVMNITTFAGAEYTAAVSTAWSDPAATFRDDIKAAADKIWQKTKVKLSNLTLILTTDRIRDMVDTLAAKESIKYTNSLLIENIDTRLSALVQYIGCKNIIPVDAAADTAKAGLSVSFKFLWNDDMAMLANLSPNVASWKFGGLGRQPVYVKLTPDYKMESYEEKANDLRIVRAKERRGTKLFKANGFLITGIK